MWITLHYNADTNVLEWVQYPEDTAETRTEYSYDALYRLAAAETMVDSGYSLDVEYGYTDDLLTSIMTNSTTYNFTYGLFAQSAAIKVGSRTLASYSYTEDQNRYLSALDYGNGDKVQYTYDTYGRLILETYEDGDTVAYTYDNNGALATVTDSATGRKTTYYYDFTDRLMKYTESGTNFYHSVGYEYDSLNNLTSLVEIINGVEHSTTYTYDDDNRVTSVSTDDSARSYTYDDFGRISQYTTSHDGDTVLTESLVYNQTQVETIVYTFENRSVYYTYAYDDNGNIVAVYESVGEVRDTEDFCSNAYTYDSANQLIREDTAASERSYVWTYDDAGNILTRTEHAYTLGTLGSALDTVVYTYGDSEWGDLLTAYDGKPITYDGIGNILTYDGWTFNWEHGRELASMSKDTVTWTFTYDANGMRTSKTNGTTAYTYVYNGSQLVQMTVGGDVLYFTYDANGRPISMTCGSDTYYYAVNLQGDVVAILDDSGFAVVSYMYDAWGNIVATTGAQAETIGALNPLRYRSYVYDSETGLYYLQSRYYNPEWGRFINADKYVSTGQGLVGNNMFAYCNNNPVNFHDPAGESISIATLILIGSAIIGAACAGYTAYVEYNAGFDTAQIIGDSIVAGMSAFMLVYSMGTTAYQCYQNFCYLHGLTPITHIGPTGSVNAQLQTCANTANAKIPGTGAVAGTYKHSAFAAEVNKLGNSSLRTEVSYLNGQEVAYGKNGSIRFDVMQFNADGAPIAAWDFKTGAAILTESRIIQMLERSGLNIPIYMIK